MRQGGQRSLGAFPTGRAVGRPPPPPLQARWPFKASGGVEARLALVTDGAWGVTGDHSSGVLNKLLRAPPRRA